MSSEREACSLEGDTSCSDIESYKLEGDVSSLGEANSSEGDPSTAAHRDTVAHRITPEAQRVTAELTG
jgi:hypothetical protein